jgi:hypothetical protein
MGIRSGERAQGQPLLEQRFFEQAADPAARSSPTG